MAWTNELLEGVAEFLDAQGVGTWLTSGAYSTNATGIVIQSMPATPASVIVLSYYSVQETPGEEYTVAGMQVRCRAPGQDPRPVNDLTDSIYEVLHGRRHFDLPGIHIVQCYRASFAPAGADENRRYMTVQNYYLQTDRATAHVLD